VDDPLPEYAAVGYLRALPAEEREHDVLDEASPGSPRCASAWLRERHQRWPVTSNPHLLINRWTAVDNTHSPIGTTTFSTVFRPTGLTMPALRQDRIRDFTDRGYCCP
jgi:hypothetical protein